MLSPASKPDAHGGIPDAKPAREPAPANGSAPPEQAVTVAVLGENTIVGRALEILLRGAGYDVRLVDTSGDGDLGAMLDGAHLLLLTPVLDGASPGARVDEVKALTHFAALPILALVTGVVDHPQQEDGAYFVPWPCRTAELVREIDAALLRRVSA